MTASLVLGLMAAIYVIGYGFGWFTFEATVVWLLFLTALGALRPSVAPR